MARSRKKTTSQQVMGIASMAMPAPVRDIVSTRWGARLCLVAAAAAVASGVVTLQWTDGKPHVQVNRDRAIEVERRLEERLEAVETNRGDQKRITDRYRWNFGDKQR